MLKNLPHKFLDFWERNNFFFNDFTVVTIPKNIHQDRATQTKKFDLASASSQTDAPPV